MASLIQKHSEVCKIVNTVDETFFEQDRVCKQVTAGALGSSDSRKETATLNQQKQQQPRKQG